MDKEVSTIVLKLTEVQSGQLHAHKAAARRLRTELSLDDRDGGVDKAHANTTDYTGHNHVRNVIGCRLQQCTL